MTDNPNYLAIDVGNSGTKAALVNPEGEVTMATDIDSPGHLMQTFRASPIKKVGLCCVGPNPDQWAEVASQLAPVINISANMDLPFEVLVEQKYTLGADRVAAVAGAHLLHPNTNRLVIDTGTCITYDVVNQKNQWLGGAISPGLQMRLDAMHHFTEGLPQIENNNPPDGFIGKNTKEAMLYGATLGAMYEMEGFCNQINQKFEQPEIILSGGTHKTFEKTVKQPIFVYPNLILIGIGVILKFNHA